MKQLLADAIFKKSKPTLYILNVGCGSAREIEELLAEKIIDNKVKITLLDQDTEALNFACAKLRSLQHNIQIDFKQKDILEIIGFNRSNHTFCEQSKDIVYSLGVVDYFMDNVLEHFIFYCYKLLKYDGKLIFASCSLRGNTDYTILRWLCDWNFVIRDPDVLKRFIVKKLGLKSVDISWEKNRQIFLVIITKR